MEGREWSKGESCRYFEKNKRLACEVDKCNDLCRKAFSARQLRKNDCTTQGCGVIFCVPLKEKRTTLRNEEVGRKELYKKHDTTEARSDPAVSKTKSGVGCKRY
jgi:hypothetical protein